MTAPMPGLHAGFTTVWAFGPFMPTEMTPRCDASRDCLSPSIGHCRRLLQRSCIAQLVVTIGIILLDGMYALIGLRLGLLSCVQPDWSRPTDPEIPIQPGLGSTAQEVEVRVCSTDAAPRRHVESLGDRSHSGRLVGSEERKSSSASMPALSTTHYARCLRRRASADPDRVPQPINAIFRSVCSATVPTRRTCSPVAIAIETEIAEAVQPLLADAEEQRRAQLAELLDQRCSQNRVLEDSGRHRSGQPQRAVDTLIVDRAANESGSLDETGQPDSG